jgi:hypothetical protein
MFWDADGPGSTAGELPAKEEDPASEFSAGAEDSARLDSGAVAVGAGTEEVTPDGFWPHAARKSETAARGTIKGIFIRVQTQDIKEIGKRRNDEIYSGRRRQEGDRTALVRSPSLSTTQYFYRLSAISFVPPM